MLTWWCFEVVIVDTGCGCVIWQVYHLFSWIIRQFKCCRRKELWDGIIFFPHVKCGSVYPVVKGETKEALKHLFLTFTEQLPSWATETLAGHFTQLDIFLSKKDYSTAAVVCQYVSALWLTNCPDCSPPSQSQLVLPPAGQLLEFFIILFIKSKIHLEEMDVNVEVNVAKHLMCV